MKERCIILPRVKSDHHLILMKTGFDPDSLRWPKFFKLELA